MGSWKNNQSLIILHYGQLDIIYRSDNTRINYVYVYVSRAIAHLENL